MRTRVGPGRGGVGSVALAFLVVFAGPSCDGEPGSPEQQTTSLANAPDEQAPGSAGSGASHAAHAGKTRLVVHEWGTFTSMSGSDGAILSGMHWTEEALPGFVHGRLRRCGGEEKCVEENFHRDVTQKLETPVLYFYGDDKTRVTVDVAFPLGIIGEWYPGASEMQPPYVPCPAGQCAPVAPAGGSMQWQVELLPADKPPAWREVDADSVWSPSRHVKANSVRRLGECTPAASSCPFVEEEMFIFYRGLGSFSLPIETRAQVDGTVTVTNRSDDDVPAAFLLRTDGERGAFVGPVFVPGNSSADFEALPSISHALVEGDPGQYIDALGTRLVEALVQAGLYEDEAWALVHTWSRSYFLSPGLRLLYIVPRPWTDELLPLSIAPEPDLVERVLVGRVEILTHEDERALMDAVDRWALDEGPAWWNGNSDMHAFARSRFAEPKVRRAMALASSPEQLWFLDGLLEYLYYVQPW